MALLQSELERLKFESGYNLLTLSALPYAFDGITQIFEQVVQPYLQAGALSTSSTAVTAVPLGSAASVVTLTLASVTGFSVGDRVIIDQDLPQEAAHVQVVTPGPNTIQVALVNAHAGTYPVTVEGGESIVREKLRQCILIAARIAAISSRAGVKRVDDIEFFPTTNQQVGARGELLELQAYWRAELCSALGIPNLRAERASAAGHYVENY